MILVYIAAGIVWFFVILFILLCIAAYFTADDDVRREFPVSEDEK